MCITLVAPFVKRVRVGGRRPDASTFPKMTTYSVITVAQV